MAPVRSLGPTGSGGVVLYQHHGGFVHYVESAGLDSSARLWIMLELPAYDGDAWTKAPLVRFDASGSLDETFGDGGYEYPEDWPSASPKLRLLPIGDRMAALSPRLGLRWLSDNGTPGPWMDLTSGVDSFWIGDAIESHGQVWAVGPSESHIRTSVFRVTPPG